MNSIGSTYCGTTPADAAARRKQLFAKLDGNGDGSISKDELAAGRPGHGRGPSVDQVFEKADANQDGGIDESENEAFLRKMHGHPPHPPGGHPAALARKIFERVDGNANGQLSREELTQILADHGGDEKVDAVFKAVDEDADGNISRSELETALKKMFEAMRGSSELSPHGYDRRGSVTSPAPTDSQFSATA